MPILTDEERKNTRKINTEEKKLLESGDYVYLEGTVPGGKKYGKLVQVRINGKPKVWKRQPDKVQVPWKYGLYEYGYIDENTDCYVTKGSQLSDHLKLNTGTDEPYYPEMAQSIRSRRAEKAEGKTHRKATSSARMR